MRSSTFSACWPSRAVCTTNPSRIKNSRRFRRISASSSTTSMERMGSDVMTSDTSTVCNDGAESTDVTPRDETRVTLEVGVDEREHSPDPPIILRAVEDAELHAFQGSRGVVDANAETTLRTTHAIVSADRDASELARLHVEARAPAMN